MASKDALTAVSWNSSFNTDMNGLSTFNTQLELDNQVLSIASKVDHSINNLYMRVSGDQFDMSDYLAADSNSSEQNGALFAPSSCALCAVAGTQSDGALAGQAKAP